MCADLVRLVNQDIIGMDGPNSLITQVIPAITVIDIPSFRAGDRNNEFSYSFAAQTTGRLGIFAAKKDNVERGVIMLLPQTGIAEGVLICITQGFGQAAATLNPLGWANPLAPKYVQFCLLKHVVNRWGAQMLASKKNLALMYIVRAKGNELGPFARDGLFVRQVLTEIAELTDGAFSIDRIEGFTFSSGVSDFNTFIGAVGGKLNVNAVYNIDPAHSVSVAQPENGTRKQYASGQAAQFVAGFEPMALNRWKNEDQYESHKKIGPFEYLHNHCMPRYCLYLGLQTS